jgi:hypothetical protein
MEYGLQADLIGKSGRSGGLRTFFITFAPWLLTQLDEGTSTMITLLKGNGYTTKPRHPCNFDVYQ